jgi:putative hydrolase of the HAD superfamily
MSAPSRPAIRAIFFDAGNTLLRMNYAIIAAHLEALGLYRTPADVQRAEWRARVGFDDAFARREPGASTERGSASGRYLRALLEGIGITDEPTVSAVAEWRRTYNAPVGLWNTADPDADAALALARDAGLRTAVISNSNGSVRSILDDLGLTGYLDFVIDSFEVGVEKPDARIFRLGLERAGLEAADVVYVGDLYSVDVLGARAAGMQGVLLDPGRCWGPRDCPTAAGPLDAVRIVLEGRGDAARRT